MAKPVILAATRDRRLVRALRRHFGERFDVEGPSPGAGLMDSIWVTLPDVLVLSTDFLGSVDSAGVRGVVAEATKLSPMRVFVCGEVTGSAGAAAGGRAELVEAYLGDGADRKLLVQRLADLLVPQDAEPAEAGDSGSPERPSQPWRLVEPEDEDLAPSSSTVEWLNFVSLGPPRWSPPPPPEPDPAGETFPAGHEPTWGELMKAGVSGRNLGRVVRKATKGSAKKP